MYCIYTIYCNGTFNRKRNLYRCEFNTFTNPMIKIFKIFSFTSSFHFGDYTISSNFNILTKGNMV